MTPNPAAKKEWAFAAAMKDFFGYRDGQGLRDFMKELSQLTDADRVELRHDLTMVGYDITR